jgi:hypothetical protein
MALGEKLKQKTLLFSGFLRTGCIQASAVAPDAYKLQPSYISDQNLQKITLNYFQSGVLTIIETTKIILRDGSR